MTVESIGNVPLSYALARVAMGDVPPCVHDIPEGATKVRLVFGEHRGFYPDFLTARLEYVHAGLYHESTWSGPGMWRLYIGLQTRAENVT